MKWKHCCLQIRKLAELTGINTILQKCPRFKSWVEKLIKVVKEDCEI